jgi:hypothetical protein
MLSRTADQFNQSPWAKLVWAAIAVIALIQLAVFYNLCTTQVDKARARDTVVVNQRNALADCLDYRNNSTIASCARHVLGGDNEASSLAARDLPRGRVAGQTVSASAVPVSFVR